VAGLSHRQTEILNIARAFGRVMVEDLARRFAPARWLAMTNSAGTSPAMTINQTAFETNLPR